MTKTVEFDINRDALTDEDGVWFVPAGLRQLESLRAAVAKECDVEKSEVAWTQLYMRPDPEGDEGAMEACRGNDPEAVSYFAVGDVTTGCFDIAGHAINEAHRVFNDVLEYIRANGDGESRRADDVKRAIARLERTMPRARVAEHA